MYIDLMPFMFFLATTEDDFFQKSKFIWILAKPAKNMMMKIKNKILSILELKNPVE